MRMYVENNIRQKHKNNRIVPTQPTASAAAATTDYMMNRRSSPTYAETANTATGVGEERPVWFGLFSCIQIQS
jgi:hypothetical protein